LNGPGTPISLLEGLGEEEEDQTEGRRGNRGRKSKNEQGYASSMPATKMKTIGELTGKSSGLDRGPAESRRCNTPESQGERQDQARNV